MHQTFIPPVGFYKASSSLPSDSGLRKKVEGRGLYASLVRPGSLWPIDRFHLLEVDYGCINGK